MVFNKKLLPNLPLILIVLLALSITVYRAQTLSIVHDEGLTLKHFVPKSYTDILNLTGNISALYANNHPFNTVLIKFFTSFLGLSEITFRLPALLGQLVFLIASYQIVKLMFIQWWKRSLALSLLVFHPFLIDFFSVGRGYGLSLGLLMAGIFFMLKAVDKPVSKNLKYGELGLFFSGLSAAGNLTFLYVYFSFLICHFFITWRIFGRVRPLLFMRGLMFSLIPVLLIYGRNFSKAYEEGVYSDAGGKGGFWIDTLPSIVQVTLYKTTSSISYKMIRIIFLAATMTGFWAILRARKPASIFLSAVFLLTSLGIYLATKIFDLSSIKERYVIFLIPLMSLFILSIWKSLDKVNKKFLGRGLIVGFLILLIGHYLTSIQFDYYYTWKYDRFTKKAFYTILENYKGLDKSRPVSIGASWVFEPSLNFYIKKENAAFITSVSRKTTNNEYDYYYIFDNFQNDVDAIQGHPQIENMEEIKTKYDLKVLERFDETKSTVLVKL